MVHHSLLFAHPALQHLQLLLVLLCIALSKLHCPGLYLSSRWWCKGRPGCWQLGGAELISRSVVPPPQPLRPRAPQK